MDDKEHPPALRLLCLWYYVGEGGLDLAEGTDRIPGVSYLSGNITPGFSFAQSTLKVGTTSSIVEETMSIVAHIVARTCASTTSTCASTCASTYYI